MFVNHACSTGFSHRGQSSRFITHRLSQSPASQQPRPLWERAFWPPAAECGVQNGLGHPHPGGWILRPYSFGRPCRHLAIFRVQPSIPVSFGNPEMGQSLTRHYLSRTAGGLQQRDDPLDEPPFELSQKIRMNCDRAAHDPRHRPRQPGRCARGFYHIAVGTQPDSPARQPPAEIGNERAPPVLAFQVAARLPDHTSQQMRFGPHLARQEAATKRCLPRSAAESKFSRGLPPPRQTNGRAPP